MNKPALLTLITDPVGKDYFPDRFLQECRNLKEPDYGQALTTDPEALSAYKEVMPDEWHLWCETYLQLNRAGKFPVLWPFRQEMIGFDFDEQLDDFETDDRFFSLGVDPVGDWFVVTQQNGCEVHLCDHHVYDLYDFWINPNHLLAWAVRSVLADENGITQADVVAFWETREQRLESATMKRLAEDLS